MRLFLLSIFCALLVGGTFTGCRHAGPEQARMLPPPASGELPVQPDAAAQPRPATPSGNADEDLTRLELKPEKQKNWRLSGEITISIVHED